MKKTIFLLLLIGLSFNNVMSSEKTYLDRNKVIEMGLKNSLLLFQAENNVEIKKIHLDHIGAWENPTIDFDTNSKVSRELGEKKIELNSISLSQSIPIFKNSAKKSIATADYELSKLQKMNSILNLKKKLSKIFYEVQYHKAQLDLHKEKLKKITKISTRKTGKIVHFVSSLDKKRLQIIKQNSALEVDQSLDVFRKSVAKLKNFLDLELFVKLDFPEISTTLNLSELSSYFDNVKDHPYIQVLKLEEEKSNSNIKLAKASRFEDPVISIYRDRDFLMDQEQINVGATLSITIPLWSHHKSEILSAKKNGLEYKLRHKKMLHSFQGRVKHAYLTLERQIRIEKQYREKVLQEANKLLEKTIQKFNTGNSSILSLIDVYESTFSYRFAYVDILFDMRNKASDLNYYSGTDLL